MLASYIDVIFAQGHEDRYTLYVHASREKPVHTSPLFIGRDIRSEKVSIFTFFTFSFPSCNQCAAAADTVLQEIRKDEKLEN